jgi:four helix bundle protein
MAEAAATHRFDLEDRTRLFATAGRAFLKRLPRTMANAEDGKQLVRSSASVGANYIEANESRSKRDFVMRVKISRKEAKESIYWLRLLDKGQLPPWRTKQNDSFGDGTDENVRRHPAEVRVT